jgi:hypothetical protein
MREKNMEKEEIEEKDHTYTNNWYRPNCDSVDLIRKIFFFLGILGSCKLNLWLVRLMV